MKKAIVTGASGFAGKYLAGELVKNNYEVYAVVRSRNSDISWLNNKYMHIIYCDLDNIRRLPEMIKDRGFDLFYHLAWDGSSGIKREKYSLQLNSVNACVTAAEIAAVLDCKKFIGAGSVTELMYRDYLVQDGSSADMSACYAIGKMSAQYMCRCVCSKNGVEFIWTYISNFYGAGDKSQNFINYLVKSYRNGITPDLTSGEQPADFIYVSDVASALVLLGEAGRDQSAYYVGYGTPRPLKDFVRIVNRMINPNVESGIGRKEFHGMHIDFTHIDTGRLERETGFRPAVKFEDGIRLLTDWYDDSMNTDASKTSAGGEITWLREMDISFVTRGLTA